MHTIKVFCIVNIRLCLLVNIRKGFVESIDFGGFVSYAFGVPYSIRVPLLRASCFKKVLRKYAVKPFTASSTVSLVYFLTKTLIAFNAFLRRFSKFKDY